MAINDANHKWLWDERKIAHETFIVKEQYNVTTTTLHQQKQQ